MAERNRIWKRPQPQPQPRPQYRRRDHAQPSNLDNPTSINKTLHNSLSNTKNNDRNAKPSCSTSNNLENEDPHDNEQQNFLGTCPFMCPVEERLQRERLRDLAVFERLNGNPSKTSPDLAVKKFCRTISMKNMQAYDVRPLSVLVDTLNYLLNLWHSSEYPFEVVHDFIFDRTRSIRQDLSIQNLSNGQVISMYEKMVEFHVISDHKFRQCSGSPDIASKSYLNMEQLKKTLMTLYSLYEANRSSESVYLKEAEFHSFYVLLHLHSDNQRESLALWFRYVSSYILKSKEMRFARNVLRYFCLGNFKRFIYIIEAEASYLQYCILEPYINEIRALAISCVNQGAYKLQPFPLFDLSKLLMMKDSDLETFCKDCGLQTSSDEVGTVSLPAKQTTFCHPKQESQKYYPLDSERFSERIFVDVPELQ